MKLVVGDEYGIPKTLFERRVVVYLREMPDGSLRLFCRNEGAKEFPIMEIEADGCAYRKIFADAPIKWYGARTEDPS